MRTLLALVVVLGVGCSGGGEEQTIRGCPRSDWSGPWTACSEARWVGRVVEAGGYSVGDGRGTGSALIAQGRGRGFYVWAAGTGADDRPPADDGVRTSWSAQGFTFWVEAGPGAADVKPTVEELDSVVAASRRLRPPPADE
jgi:hypothetical protein